MASPSTFDPYMLDATTPLSDFTRFPPGAYPYYIVAPAYARTSAGIRALHLLCHSLNRAGQEAYMLIYPDRGEKTPLNPNLLTPLATSQITARHRAQNRAPILVYPETTSGNPIGARTVVRYVLNFPGHIAGDTKYAPGEIIFGYSESLAEAAGAPKNVLLIPISDISIFNPGQPRPRSGTCFWAMKYQHVHHGKLLPVTQNSTEITRGRPDSQTQAEIAELFRSSELFYAYENTALALEAALCLCPSVLLPNPWFRDLIATKEMGMDGIALGTDPAEIARAKATVHRVRDNYLANFPRFWDQLANFIAITQSRAAAGAAHAFPPTLPWRARWQPKIARYSFLPRRAMQVLKQSGPRMMLKKILRKLQ